MDLSAKRLMAFVVRPFAIFRGTGTGSRTCVCHVTCRHYVADIRETLSAARSNYKPHYSIYESDASEHCMRASITAVMT